MGSGSTFVDKFHLPKALSLAVLSNGFPSFRKEENGKGEHTLTSAYMSAVQELHPFPFRS